jgi:hypothetical protein
MPRTSRGFHRLIGARMSRTIPLGTKCQFCAADATHRIWGVTAGGFVCAAHAEQGKNLGYEIIQGEIK